MGKIAVIRTGGKQYLVKEGDKIKVEKLRLEKGENVNFETLLTEDEGKVDIGAPIIKSAGVVGEVLDHGRAKKINVIKYKAKVRYKKKTGHRQHYTLVGINKIG